MAVIINIPSVVSGVVAMDNLLVGDTLVCNGIDYKITATAISSTLNTVDVVCAGNIQPPSGAPLFLKKMGGILPIATPTTFGLTMLGAPPAAIRQIDLYIPGTANVSGSSYANALQDVAKDFFVWRGEDANIKEARVICFLADSSTKCQIYLKLLAGALPTTEATIISNTVTLTSAKTWYTFTLNGSYVIHSGQGIEIAMPVVGSSKNTEGIRVSLLFEIASD